MARVRARNAARDPSICCSGRSTSLDAMCRGRGPSMNRKQFLRAMAVAACAGPPAIHRARSAVPERMHTRPIPATGMPLPVVGCGTWRTFDVGPGAAEREPLAEVLRILFEHGGMVIDSSPMYG